MSDEERREEDVHIAGERGAGITSVAEATGRGQNIFRSTAAVLITVLAIGFLYVTWDRDRPEEGQEESRPSISPSVPFTPAPLPAPDQESPAPAPPQPPSPPSEQAQAPQLDNEMLEASMRAPLIAFSANVDPGRPQPTDGQAPEDVSLELPSGLLDGQSRRESLEDKLQATELHGVRASVLADLHMVVPQGTSIPCVLQTAVSSDQPGFVSCIIQRDVLSASGQVVLMEKGTMVVGEYTGSLKRGKKRIFVLWNRARTPGGIVVDLASPAADGLGRTGFDGSIDNHFWQRFGGAILMSIVTDASKYAFEQFADGTQVDTGETEGTTRSAAAIALENSINIPPTLYKNQGEVVSIFVARDLDFSSVYDLRVTDDRNTIYDRSVTGDMRPAPVPLISK